MPNPAKSATSIAASNPGGAGIFGANSILCTAPAQSATRKLSRIVLRPRSQTLSIGCASMVTVAGAIASLGLPCRYTATSGAQAPRPP